MAETSVIGKPVINKKKGEIVIPVFASTFFAFSRREDGSVWCADRWKLTRSGKKSRCGKIRVPRDVFDGLLELARQTAKAEFVAEVAPPTPTPPKPTGEVGHHGLPLSPVTEEELDSILLGEETKKTEAQSTPTTESDRRYPCADFRRAAEKPKRPKRHEERYHRPAHRGRRQTAPLFA